MSKSDRRKKIMDMLEQRGTVAVDALASALDVSDVTIRSDLSSLEKEGLLYRTHGGAVLRPKTIADSAVSSPALRPSVLATAKLAAQHIREKSWIFLGSGSTCHAISQQLENRSINVVTNSLPVANTLLANNTVNVIMTGGSLFKNQQPFLYGDQLLHSLSNLSFTQAFIGVSGIDRDFGFSISNSVENSIFQKVCQISQEVVVAADSSKYSQTSFMGIGPLSVANTVVSSGDVPREYIAYFADNNIRMITD